MAQKGLYLNGDPVSLPDGITTFAMNVELDDNMLSYVNSKGFETIPIINKYKSIKGVCELPNGFIIFGSNYTDDNKDYLIYIDYYIEVGYDLILEKHIATPHLKYKGTSSQNIMNCRVSCSYIYNYKKELIITFCIDKDNDIYIINMNDINGTKMSDKTYMDTCILVPDVKYPFIEPQITKGSLYAGVYQFAIQFKYSTGEYSDFSPLTPVVSIYNESSVGLEVNTQKGIILYFRNRDPKYTICRIAILHIGAETTTCYVTPDTFISINGDITNNVNIFNIENYSTIPVESILVKTIPVVGAEDCSVNNNKLLLANIKINNVHDDTIESISKYLHLIKFLIVQTNTYISDNVFTRDEIYIFYLGILDLKGKIVTSIPIPIQLGEGYSVVNEYGLKPALGGDYNNISTCHINCNLNEFISNLGHINNVSGFVILFAEHTESNSKVLSEGYAIRDGYVVDGRYKDQLVSSNIFRIYPFDQLYNIRSSIDCKIQTFVNITGNSNFFTLTRDFPPEAKEFNPGGANLGVAAWRNGFHGHISAENGTITNLATSSSATIKFISPLNEAENNIQGDSFFRYTTDGVALPIYPALPSGWDERQNLFPHQRDRFGNNIEVQNLLRNRVYLVRLLNNHSGSLESLYGDIKSQKLTIASPVIPMDSSVMNFKLTGDTFRGFYAVRVKSPSSDFSITQSESYDDPKSVDTKTGCTNQVIICGHIVSKYNLNARFQEDQSIHNVVLKTRDPSKLKDWSNDGYQFDTNFGHTKGDIYNKCFNENGIEYYPIRTLLDIDKINIVTNRIIRSDVISTESTTLGWRYFRPTAYSDVDSTKGDIISIKASDKKLYIQCRYGLKINTVKDVIDTNSAEMTYLGTGDLFDRQSIELIYSPVGYIGCEYKHHCYYSVFGYIVIDRANSKIFVINEEGIKCITDGYVAEWFRTVGFNSHMTIGVDQDNKVMYITSGERNTLEGTNYSNYDNIDNQFANYTIGFNFISNSWISFYSWIPYTTLFTSRLYVFVSQSNGRLQLARQTTERGVYGFNINNDTVTPVFCKSVIKTLFSQPAKGSQLLKSIIWDTKHYNRGAIDETKTFNRILVHTANQCSELLPIDLVKDKSNWWNSDKGANQKDIYEFNNFKDCMKNRVTLPVGNILTGYVIKPDVIDYNKIWFDKAAFINMYFFVSLEYDNVDVNNTFIVNTILPILISNYR